MLTLQSLTIEYLNPFWTFYSDFQCELFRHQYFWNWPNGYHLHRRENESISVVFSHLTTLTYLGRRTCKSWCSCTIWFWFCVPGRPFLCYYSLQDLA